MDSRKNAFPRTKRSSRERRGHASRELRLVHPSFSNRQNLWESTNERKDTFAPQHSQICGCRRCSKRRSWCGRSRASEKRGCELGRNLRSGCRGFGRRRHGCRREGCSDGRQESRSSRKTRLYGRQYADFPGLHQCRRPRSTAASGHQGFLAAPCRAVARCGRLPRSEGPRRGALQECLSDDRMARKPRHEV